MPRKKLFLAVAVLPLLLISRAATGETPASDTDSAAVAAMRAATKEMGARLQQELKAALAASGPVAAVQVCKTVAPQIASEQSVKSGVTLKRTALRVRNPANAPDELERKVLEDFAAKVAAGTDPVSLERVETVQSGGKSQLRYFKAIAMGKDPCVTCHGSELSPELKDALAKLYPSDQATGFKPGELRGIFSVSMETAK